MEATSGDDLAANQEFDIVSMDRTVRRQTSSFSDDSDDSDDDDEHIDKTSSQMLEGLNVNSKIKNLLKYANIDTSSSEDEDEEPISKPTTAKPSHASLLPPRKPRVPTSSVISRMEKRTDWNKTKVPDKNNMPSAKSPELPSPSVEQDVSAMSVTPSQSQRDPSPPNRPKPDGAAFKKILNDMLAESSSDDSDDERLFIRQKRLQDEMTPQKTQRTMKKSPKETDRIKKASKPTSDSPKPSNVISIKAKMELHKESERLYRSTDMKLRVSSQPKKTMASFLEKMQSAKKAAAIPNTQIKPLPNMALPEFDAAMNTITDVANVQSDSDSDLEIIGSADQPKTLASAVGVSAYSPARLPMVPKQKRRTPVKIGVANARPPAMTHKDLNATLKQTISLHMLKRRNELEVRLREKGLYTSAEELARKHVDREKQAQSIHEEVERIHARTLKTNTQYSGEADGDDSQSDSDESYASEKEDLENDDSNDDSDVDNDPFEQSEDDEIQVDKVMKSASPIVRRNRKMAIISDDDDDEEASQDQPASAPMIETASLSKAQILSDSDTEQKAMLIHKPIKPRVALKKSRYVENEAEEEEDEYMGLGGVDGEDDDGPDEYVEDDVVVHANEEALDEAQLRQAFNNQMADSDQNEIQRLIKDVVSGGLRRRRGAMNDGYELDYYDTFDDMDDNLVALRRAAAAKRRKLLNGNVLQAIAENPETAAFAKASRVDIEEDDKPSFSDGEEEESQPVVEDEYAEDDEDDEETDGTTFAETVAAMKQSTINEEKTTVMEDITVFTEEPMSNEVEDDTWSSVTITQRRVATKNFISPLQPNRIRSSPLFRSPGKLQKFKNLLQEAGGAIGGSSETGSPHVGFSAPSRSQEDRSASISSQRSNSSSTSASQESYTPLSRKGSRLLDILSSQESTIA